MITYAFISESGGRKINEDSVGVRQSEDRILCVLADGLGGHGAGEVASSLAVETALRVFERDTHPPEELVTACMLESQEAILSEQRRQNRTEDMKTTATMLLIRGDEAQWAHIGDSRIYMFDGASKQISRTLDHSVPQMLAIQGEIREKDIRHHEDRNRLTRVMGVEWETPKYTLSEQIALTPPSTFLLCSDGFWELIEEKEMSRHLKKSASPESWLADMERVVLINGKNKNMDNYSAIAVFVR